MSKQYNHSFEREMRKLIKSVLTYQNVQRVEQLWLVLESQENRDSRLVQSPNLVRMTGLVIFSQNPLFSFWFQVS